MSPTALETLRAGTAGHELLFPRTPTASVLAKAEPDPRLLEADIAFGQPDTRLVELAQNLKWIQVSSSGITRYDTPKFRQLMADRGIAVCNSASVYCNPCAVHVLSFMLAHARNLPAALPSRAPNGSPAWDELRQTSSTLSGETVLILGYGAIGRRLTELLQPFGMNLIAYRRTARGDEPVPVVTETNLAEALKKSDHVVNILPDSPETRLFFDTARFVQLKPGAVFYNIGRGSTVNQDALLQVLQSRQLRAAWLDVTNPEPLPENHPLRREPHCHITPHIAGGHPDETRSLVCHFVENFQRFLERKPLQDRVM